MQDNSSSASYGSHLWGSFKAIEQQSEQSRAFLKRLHTFVKDKSELDRSYAKSLKKIVEKLQVEEQQPDSSSFETFLASFKNLNTVVSASFDHAAVKTEEQVDRPLVVYQETHKKSTKSIEEEIIKAQRNLSAYQDAVDSAKQACRKACEELQRAKESNEQAEANAASSSTAAPEPSPPAAAEASSSELTSPPSGADSAKKRFGNLFKRDAGTKLFAAMSNTMHSMQASVSVNVPVAGFHRVDLSSLQEKVQNADAKYMAAVKSMRAFRPQHDQHVLSLLDQMQAQEEEARSTSTDLLANYLQLQSSLFSSNVESMHAVGAVLGKVNASKDSQQFIRRYRSEGKPPALPRYEMPRSHPQYVESEHEHDDSDEADSSTQSVRKANKKDTEEERSYARISAEQVLTLFVDKVTGYSTDKNTSTSSDNAHSAQHEGHELDPKERDEAARLFRTPEGRIAFATVVNLQRNRGQLHLSYSAFNSFASLVTLFLDHAREAMHVAPIQLVMILSQSLWRDATPEELASMPATSPLSSSSSSSSPRKIFLTSLIRSHPVWREERFWEESFFDAFRSKLTADQVFVHKWHSDSEQRESMHARKQATFATLSTFAMNMAEFGMSKAMIDNFVEKQATLNELDSDMKQMLVSIDSLPSQRVSIDAGEQQKQQQQPAILTQHDSPPAVTEATATAPPRDAEEI